RLWFMPVLAFAVAAGTGSAQWPPANADHQPAAEQQTTEQPAEAPPTIRVNVDIVNVFCTVRNKQGGLVPGLKEDDFEIAEDGKPQTIKYFSRETDLPLTLGLLIDVSLSQKRLIEDEKEAASEFFTQVLKSKDLAFLISFGTDSELLQDYTSSARLLRKGLDGLKVDAPPPQFNSGPVPTIYTPRGTVLRDAVYVAAREQLKGQIGRKALIVISDGVDEGSRVKLQEAIDAAQKADAIIYSIDYADPRAYGSFGIGMGASDLKKLSEDTGGRVYKVDRKHPLSAVFKELQEELRTQYTIGYIPTNPVKDGTFRRILVKTKNDDLKVQTRKGYFAEPPDSAGGS
ncbi:MAG: VWA domain-containing protein, partial [Bryobacteraceae bacterium]